MNGTLAFEPREWSGLRARRRRGEGPGFYAASATEDPAEKGLLLV